jgi:sugar lactone lactonase YvrE
MSDAGRIEKIDPSAAIPGGEIVVACKDFDTNSKGVSGCLFDGERGHLVAASAHRVMVLAPENNFGGSVQVSLESDGEYSDSKEFILGTKLAEDLHPVTNPAFDPDDGSLFVTRSGSRGQQLPVTLFRIDTNGDVQEFSGDIVNPTGIAFDPSGQMFVTSRMDGIVYRVTPFKEAVVFAQNLGVATGIAFDKQGRMYVGDRTGTIYRINGIGEGQSWAQAEPSVSAYHIAFGPDGSLYLTGPTVSSHESVLRFDEAGTSSVFFRGLGRPQGLAFDREGNLYVAASLRGRRGIVRIKPDGSNAELVVAGMNVVGLAFSPDGDLIVATTESVFSLPLGIQGTLLDV